MKMSFWWDCRLSDFLFKGLSASSAGALFGLCVCVAIMAFLFEVLRYLQARQRQKELKLRSLQLRAICPPTDTSTLLEGPPAVVVTRLDRTCLLGTDLSLWFLLQNLGYLLMLTIMLYNGWLFISAVLGGGCGYFVFGQRFMKLNLQNCQIIRDTFCMRKCGESETVATSRDGESTPALEAAAEGAHCHEVRVSVHVESDDK